MCYKCGCDKKCVKKQIYFFNDPIKKSWVIADNEVVLFDRKICLSDEQQAMVDVSIASQIVNPTGDNSTVNAYNVYKLYINGEQVSQSGYEAESDTFAPNLETSNLIWGGCINQDCNNCCGPSLHVRVSTQLISSGSGTAPATVSSNIDNSNGSFLGAKGAFLRVFIL